ncbi:non-ribosomal peptide synthetase [Mycobacteroides abscessus]|uniref:non-ribosomal peptide synthetase n=1 Tax=Mycobacteroides abscessus TaxID=36809 RepID=UPI000C262580|nr:non-ribosomal peptide synthetase [Mycobacteroides abscessus]
MRNLTYGQLKIEAARRPTQARYWERVLADVGKTPFPSDRIMRPVLSPSVRDAVTITLSERTAERLVSLSNGQDAALHVLLTSGVVALLHKYTNSEDILVGQPTTDCAPPDGHGQYRPSMSVLRCPAHGDLQFRALAETVRNITLDVLANQDFPLELYARTDRAGTNSLFDVAVELIGYQEPGATMAVDTPLLFRFAQGDALTVTLDFDQRQFSTSYLSNVARQFGALMDQVTSNPAISLGAIDLLTPAEGDLLSSFNATATDVNSALTIHELCSRRAAAAPDAVAVVGTGVQLTYAQLDARANQLAHSLIAQGVGPGDRVAIMVGRSAEMLVAVLAVLKAGGVYLPIDPGYPPARIHYMLQDSGAMLVLARRDIPEAKQSPTPVVDLDDSASYSSTTTTPSVDVHGGDLAYMIYTSGSTGTPKGVLIEHHSVVNRLSWMQRAYPLDHTDVILQKTSISFDVSVWELFWWMIEGAAVCLLEPNGERDPDVITAAIERHSVTVTHFVPTMLTAFLDYVRAAGVVDRLSTLRTVFASGEALGPNTVTAFRELFGSDCATELVNLYGPTEATVDVTHFRCTADLNSVPIGKPIDNTRIHIVDNVDGKLRPLPIGIAGELCIAGAGIARGYHRRPELTAQRFVENPFPGERRVYRTGDLARWLPDGNIEFLGRVDHQIKIRGHRVETGEIEFQLRSISGVSDAVVTAWTDDGGQQRLCCYAVTEDSTEDIRRKLLITLPEYLIPSVIFPMKAFPLTPNGKVDRQALPHPTSIQDFDAGNIEDKHGPRDAIETIVAAIWRQVLGRDSVGIHDDFFSLGGNSVNVVSVAAQAHLDGLDITPTLLFQNPTIAGLANSLSEKSMRRKKVDVASENLEIRTLPDLFHHSVRQYPDRPAVSDSKFALSYTELDQRSDSVATMLYSQGIKPEDRVGVYLNRSVAVFVAILGSLKAGAAYVAVDTRYPNSRRDLMLRNSGAKVILTESGLVDGLECLGADLILFDGLDASDSAAPASVVIEPSSGATVLFTSGSSGTPKAIMLEHRNVVSFAVNPSLPSLNPEDRTGQISSVSFDAFHFEMWRTFAAGAEVVVLPAVSDLLAADFQRQMRRHRITAMLVPTMVLNHVIREDRDAFAPLRILQAGGDIILPSACRDLLGGEFSGELYNLYGPAEITTACTAHRITMADADTANIPIGRALDGVTLHILSGDRQPVDIEEVGELYVGGPGVARGYLGAPDLTEQRFLPDPLNPSAGRVYRTGDLVRERADGVLEFIGRADDQVKIRGYRVELGEVEVGLRRHPGVHDSVVLADGSGNDQRLVAFVVFNGSTSAKELRRHAESELPDFMIPSNIIVLKEIPSSEHGKRDHSELRRILIRYQERADRYEAPTTETERYLATVWEELLGVERIGATDDFFALGGHSLQAFRTHRRIQRELGVQIEHSKLLSKTILRDLAQVVDEARTNAKSS